MHRKIMPLGAIGANCVILWNDPSAAWIVDPGASPEAICSFLDENGLAPALVVFTHGHFDHIGAVDGLLERYPGLPVHIGPGDVPMIGHPQNAWPPDYEAVKRPATLAADLVDGAMLSAGGIEAKIIATPGHTPGGVCLLFAEEKLLLTGDTLFAGSCGRTDFPGGDRRQLNASLRRLAALDPELVVVPGHGMPTTIAREVATNPFLQ
ncbi:MAG: MBL fold metallo-hydrolase [Kiritimatiellae bacterium]|nr:MBL fold metallo-hydrolase [Kiritimatiellia bacterium]